MKLAPRIVCAFVFSAVSAVADAQTSPITQAIKTEHPRLYFNAADVPKLQKWAVASNPVYKNWFTPMLAQCLKDYPKFFAADGTPVSPFPDNGDGQGYKGPFEHYMLVFAFASVIEPEQAKRDRYAGYARTFLMHAMDQAALGLEPGKPYRDKTFVLYNRNNATGDHWGLTVDWLQAGNYLSAADKATCRKAFLIWAHTLTATHTFESNRSPPRTVNSTTLLPDGNQPYRRAVNNYNIGFARTLASITLCLDAEDDPGDELRGYLADLVGKMLYLQYSMFAEPADAAKLYGLSNVDDFGLASDGLPVEGMLYGGSLAMLFGELLMLATATSCDPAVFGQQIDLLDAPFIRRFPTAYLSQVDPYPVVPAQAWMGPTYLFPGFGDMLRGHVEALSVGMFALHALLQSQRGDTSQVELMRWAITNLPPGGAAHFNKPLGNPLSYQTSWKIQAFLAMDPKAAPTPKVDPRFKTFPKYQANPNCGRWIARTGWGPDDSIFAYSASPQYSNHMNGDAGSFGLFRKGEWVTKILGNYDNKEWGHSCRVFNTLCVENKPPSGLPPKTSPIYYLYLHGDQFWGGVGQNAGDPTTHIHHTDDYVHAQSDLTNLYNQIVNPYQPQNAATSVKEVSRSILWISRQDTIVVYDRVTSLDGLFKNWNFCSAKEPKITGNTVVAPSTSGKQSLTVQCLLPNATTIAAAEMQKGMAPPAALEPMHFATTIADPSLSASTRFLNVVQATDSGTAATPATFVKSSAGTDFEGAVIGGAAVLFQANTADKFSTTTFALPPAVKQLYVSGLPPDTSCQLKRQGASLSIDLGPGTKSDASGLLVVKVTNVE
jgi:hypothetical protein